MYLIVGLGNPENEYSKTRHNMGFDVINKLSEKYKISVNKNKFEGLYGTGEIEGEKVILLKPQTYMNLSGESIIQFVNYYKITEKEIVVIYDDKDTKQGTIKIRKQGGPGSHNGMKSVVNELGTENFTRIRIGVGTEQPIENMIDFVIKKVDDETYNILNGGIEKAEKAISSILTDGIDIAMNKYN